MHSIPNHSNWKWYLDQVFVKINGETHYLWRAVDHEGEVLKAFVSKRRDCNVELVFLKKVMKHYGQPRAIVTDRLRSYRAAMKIIGNGPTREVRRWLNNRAENCHLPFRRQEYAMLKFRRMQSLQKFTSIHSSVQNHFNLARHLIDREFLSCNVTLLLLSGSSFVLHKFLVFMLNRDKFAFV